MDKDKKLKERAGRSRPERQNVKWPAKEAGWILIDRISDCIFIVDRKTKGILRSNPAASRLLGHEPKSLFELEDHPIESIENWVGQLGPKGIHAERKYRRGDGSALLMDMQAQMLDQETILVISRDCASRRRVELEKRNSERMALLAFVAKGIAHDMCNCLMMINSNASVIIEETGQRMVNDPALRSEILRNAQDVLRAGELLRIMSKKLENLGTGIEEKPRPIAVKRLLRNSSHFLTKPRLKVAIDIPDDIWPVMAVPSHASRAIENLFTNTLQAMEGLKLGSASVWISAENLVLEEGNRLSLDPGRYVMISFKDDAGGIAEKILPTIFEYGFSTKGGGRGVGLAISRFNIRECGGEMDVESIEGIGTTFRICLPASDTLPVNKKPITGDFNPPL